MFQTKTTPRLDPNKTYRISLEQTNKYPTLAKHTVSPGYKIQTKVRVSENSMNPNKTL